MCSGKIKFPGKNNRQSFFKAWTINWKGKKINTEYALILRRNYGDTQKERRPPCQQSPYLYENEYDFMPVFKLFINTNYLPVVIDETLLTSRRTKVITFIIIVFQDESLILQREDRHPWFHWAHADQRTRSLPLG